MKSEFWGLAKAESVKSKVEDMSPNEQLIAKENHFILTWVFVWSQEQTYSNTIEILQEFFSSKISLPFLHGQ